MPSNDLQKSWTRQEAEDFNAHVRLRNKRLLLDALQITACFLAVLAASAFCFHNHRPFLAELGLWAAAGIFVWVVIRHWLLFASWNSARLTRRDFGEPL